MSNLSELLPSGGGQNLVEFVASGTLPNGKPVILNSNGTVSVISESTVSGSLGSADVFNNNTSGHTGVAMLSATKAIVVYEDTGNSGYGTACVLDISGSTITSGTEVVFNGALTESYLSITPLSSTKAIAVYRDGNNSHYGKACVLTASGSTITAGTQKSFNNASTGFTTAARLTDTKAIVVYQDNGNSNYGTSCILDVSGSTITSGTELIFNNGTTVETTVAMLTSTKAIVVYRDISNSSYGTSCILDVSGSTITSGTEVVFNSASTLEGMAVSMLTSTKAIAAYKDTNSYGTSCILDVSGSTITAGTEVVFNSAQSEWISLAGLTSTKAIVAYRDYGNSHYGNYCSLDVSGSTITAGTELTYNSALANENSVARLTDTKAIVTYKNWGNSNYGTANVINVEYLQSTLTATNLIGIASEATSSGDTAKINTWGGINEAQTSLTIASDYYAQTDGTITTVSTSPAQKLGTAINATTINMKDLT